MQSHRSSLSYFGATVWSRGRTGTATVVEANQTISPRYRRINRQIDKYMNKRLNNECISATAPKPLYLHLIGAPEANTVKIQILPGLHRFRRNRRRVIRVIILPDLRARLSVFARISLQWQRR